jgi:hypothetical protein
MVKTAALIVILALAGCATSPGPIADPRAVWCAENDPIRLPVTAIATLSRPEKERLLAYLLKGEAWCGWKP